MTADQQPDTREADCRCGHRASDHPRRFIARSLGPRTACIHFRDCGCRDGYQPHADVPVSGGAPVSDHMPTCPECGRPDFAVKTCQSCYPKEKP